MLVPEQVRQAYSNTNSLIKDTGNRVRSFLKPFCEANGFLFCDRVKTLESIAEKIESGRYGSWREIDDLYACTIVVSLASSENEVLNYLERTFDKTKIQLKNAPKPPDIFRFDTTRFHGKLRPIVNHDATQTESVFSIEFEVQIKSVLDFAWSTTTHALVYKAATVDWRRLRLAAQLKAVVEQIDMLFLSFEANADTIVDCTWPNVSDKEAIQKLFEEYVDEEKIPSEMVPKDWSRFSDNIYRALQAFAGQKADGEGDERLTQQLTDLQTALDAYITSTPIDMFPKSLSLFQVVVGVLGTCGIFNGSNDAYYLPISPGMRELFPGLILPGSEFETE